jgi:lipoprotein-anchoring transpeptidase ErfK/SrfK
MEDKNHNQVQKYLSNTVKYIGLFIFSICILGLINAVSAAQVQSSSQGSILFSNTTLAANTFVYNPRTLRWKALRNGKVVKSGRGSGGSGYCRDIKRSCRTPTGSYRIIGKRGAGCKSSRYPVGKGGAPMPYCMFFSKYYAIHGSPNVPNYNASHGCIRVRPSAARWLHSFLKIGSKVIVKSY